MGTEAMTSTSRLTADAIVGCMGSGREPTAIELASLAERIWNETSGHRSAFAWGELLPFSLEKQHAINAANLALRGDLLLPNSQK